MNILGDGNIQAAHTVACVRSAIDLLPPGKGSFVCPAMTGLSESNPDFVTW